MGEAGIDMRDHRSKHVEAVAGIDFDYVITVCDSARDNCPVFPGRARLLHAGFDDPPRLAAGVSTEEEALAIYRRVRDQIRDFVAKLPELTATREDGPSHRSPA